MELRLEEIEGSEYQNFVDSVRDKETLRKYDSYLAMFLDLIPNSIFKKYLNYEPLSRKKMDLAVSFVNLAQSDVKIAKSIIAAYVRDMKKLHKEGKLMPATIKNRLKPIKALLKSNDIEISWYLVDKSLPKIGKSTDRAYTRQELQNMMEKAIDITDKVILTTASSSGIRVESWNFFTWSDLVIFYNEDKTPKGGALRVYHGDIEEYWTHITPEAAKFWLIYKEMWKSRFMNYPNPTDPLLVQVKKSHITRLGLSGVKARVTTMATAIGLRPPLEHGKMNHEVMINHGMRKYHNTMLRRAKIDYADKEDMQGRSPGAQERSYERYVEQDFERFTEYSKAIYELTIADVERNKFKLVQKEETINKLQQKTKKIDQLEETIKTLSNEIKDKNSIEPDQNTVNIVMEILKSKKIIK
jgi:hypothetical protein